MKAHAKGSMLEAANDHSGAMNEYKALLAMPGLTYRTSLLTLTVT